MNQRMTKETASETRAFAYNLSGNMIREQTTYWSEYVYLGGHRLAMVINGTPPGSGCSFIKGGNWKNVALNTLLIFSPAFLFAVIIYRRKNTLKAVFIICGMSGAIILVSYLTTPALEEGTEIKWFLNDHLDTPMWMVNADKSMYNRRYLDAYGNPSNEFHPQLNNFFFPGQYRDQEGYLYYNWNRYYMPWVGRYNSPDPLLNSSLYFILMNSTFKINHYIYANNNPFLFTDPIGLWYAGGEFNFIGGAGFSLLTCCDKNNNKHYLTFVKVCYGAGFNAGVSGGKAWPSGKNCENNFSGLTPEFGAGIGPVGVEVGTSISNENTLVPYVGGGIGIGGKATVCWYFKTGDIVKGCCGK